MSETHLKLKSCEISFVHNTRFKYPISLKICTVSLPRSVQNFKTIGQLRLVLWASEISWDLGLRCFGWVSHFAQRHGFNFNASLVSMQISFTVVLSVIFIELNYYIKIICYRQAKYSDVISFEMFFISFCNRQSLYIIYPYNKCVFNQIWSTFIHTSWARLIHIISITYGYRWVPPGANVRLGHKQ